MRTATTQLISTGLITLLLASGSTTAAPTQSATNNEATDDQQANTTAYGGTRASITLGHAIAGALLGGPLGYAIGVFTGDWVSNRVIEGYENETSLEQVTTAFASLQSSNHRLQSRLASVGSNIEELQRLAADSLQLQVLFRTGKGELADDGAQRIEQLAQFLQQQPQLRVRLSGYADPRGAESYNDALSAERIASVAQLLEQQGVAAGRITTEAYGESLSRAAKDDLDSYALERRVEIELLPPVEDLSLADAR